MARKKSKGIFEDNKWVVIVKEHSGNPYYLQFVGKAYPILETLDDGKYLLPIPIDGEHIHTTVWSQEEVRDATKKEKRNGQMRIVAEKI